MTTTNEYINQLMLSIEISIIFRIGKRVKWTAKCMVIKYTNIRKYPEAHAKIDLWALNCVSTKYRYQRRSPESFLSRRPLVD